MKKLNWIELAKEQLGVTEIEGGQHNPVIMHWLDEMGFFSNESKAWWRDDETPWCGLFVGWVLGKAGRYVVKEWYRAKEWKQLKELNRPAYGCLAVYNRSGGGHVGFVVGRDSKGRVMVLGGNQGDSVSILPFNATREVSYHWPSFWRNGKEVKSAPLEGRYKLPLISGNFKESVNEQ